MMAAKPQSRKAPSRKKPALAEATEPLPSVKSLVFVSHDSRDADLAEVFSNLLSDVSAGMLKSFRSSDKKGTSGIEFGAEWYSAIMSQLGDASDVVALLTKQSLDRPWILYEAGVAKGKLETTVFGVALGVPLNKVSTGPFGQFQNCGDDEDSLTKLVMQLIRRNPEAAPREEAVRLQVRSFREQTEKILAARGEAEEPSADEQPAAAKLFEEVKAMFRELPERIDDRIRTVARRPTRRRLLSPGMFEELIFRSSRSPSGMAASWLLIISELKDDLPWFYEAGLQLYRALQVGNRPAAKRAEQNIRRLTRLAMDSPFSRAMEDKETFYALRHVEELIHRMIDRMPESKRPVLDDDSERDDATAG